MAMCKCKKSNPRNPRPCGCMSNPRKRRNPGTKQPADQYQFAKWRDAAKQMTDAELLYVIKDARQAAQAMRGHDPIAEGWYEDEAFTMADELRHRRERAAGKRRNPDIEYGSDDYRIGLFQGAVEKGKAPPPPSTSKELRSGYTAGARIAKAKPAAVQRALGVYGVTRDHARAGDELRDATLGTATTANPRKRRNPSLLSAAAGGSYDETERMRKIKKMAAKGEVKDWILTDREGTWERDIRKLIRQTQEDPAFVAKIKDMGLTEAKVNEQIALKIRLDALHAMLNYAKKTSKRRNPTVKEHSERAKERIKLIQSQLAWSNNQEDARERKRGVAQAMLVAGMAESDLWDGTPEKDHAYVERLDSMISGIGRELSRNPMSAAARKHLAHEKDEEKTFAAMMAKLPVGVTLKAGKHRIRKLSKGFVVVDGERLTEKQAAAKIHRGK